MFLPGTEVGLAEAYLHNHFDIEGDIEAAFDIADFLLTRREDWTSKLKLAGTLPAQAGNAATPYLTAGPSLIRPGPTHSPGWGRGERGLLTKSRSPRGSGPAAAPELSSAWLAPRPLD